MLGVCCSQFVAPVVGLVFICLLSRYVVPARKKQDAAYLKKIGIDRHRIARPTPIRTIVREGEGLPRLQCG